MNPLPPLHDVAIVGTGPAGASAATIIAQNGLNAILLEKNHIPRYKTCGGGILPRALALLDLNHLHLTERECHTAEFNLSPTLRFQTHRPNPIIYMTMRNRFDAWLVNLARAAGTQLRTNCTVQNITPETDSLRLSTNQGDIRARYVIAADGANSIIARKALFPAHRTLAPAVECEVTLDDFPRWSTAARFDFDALPAGYGWVFPKRSHLSIGVLSLSTRVNLNQAFSRYLSRLQITPQRVERHGYVIPLAPRSPILARDGILLTGDAAGLADPITAEGITNAIHSAQLAARAIVSGSPNRSHVTAQYQLALERQILNQLACARPLAHLLYHMPRIRNQLFRYKGPQLTRAMTRLITGQTTYTQLLQSPSTYTHLLKLHSTVGDAVF